MIYFNKFLSTLLSYCSLYSFRNIKRLNENSKVRNGGGGAVRNCLRSSSSSPPMSQRSDGLLLGLFVPRPFCVSADLRVPTCQTHVCNPLRPPTNCYTSSKQNHGNLPFLLRLLDGNIFPTSTTGLVYEGEEVVFVPVFRQPQVAPYLLNMGSKIFTQRQKM